MMHPLVNPVRHYAWGSRTHIPAMCGGDYGDRPCAELWLGAHPGDPSRLADGRSLDEAVAEDAKAMLGEQVDTAFGARLPYLLKLLAVAEPLSLQVHPTSERARIGFAEQEAQGLARSAPERSYQDPWHKPELVFALTRFEGMAGFRATAKTAAILRGLRVPWLDLLADRIENTLTPFQTLREVATELFAMDGDSLRSRLQQLRAAATAAEASAHRPPLRQRPTVTPADHLEREQLRVYAATVPLIDRYPDDPGVLVTLLLNHVVLAAGEAMFIDAGVIHTYTSGFAIEIMASSDNVVRAGLTPKHVDRAELLEITNFAPMPPPLWAPQPAGVDGGELLAPPVQEFELGIYRLEGGEQFVLTPAPRIVLCLDGAVEVVGSDETISLRYGQSMFVEECSGTVRLGGRGRVAVGRTPT